MKPLPWSFSSLSDFVNCPRQFYHKRVLKDVVDSPNEATLWGNEVHKAFENYLKGIEDLPENMSQFHPYMQKLQGYATEGSELFVEYQMALNRKVQPCEWFAEDVWCRAISDVLYLHRSAGTAVIVDHKTGKVKPDSRQLKLNALIVFATFPEVNYCGTEFQWVKHNQETREGYWRSREADLWQEFLPDLTRYKVAFKAEVFNPKPSGLCNGWCPVTSCEHWKPKRELR